MNTPSTNDLLQRLNAVDSISALETYNRETLEYSLITTFPEYIKIQMQKIGFSAARLIADAGIQRNYGYQILNGIKKPGRNKILALCLALKLSFEDTQRALTLAKEGILYPKNTRDSILIFCLNKKLSVIAANQLLYDKEQELL